MEIGSKKNKKLCSFKFDEDFKKELDTAAAIEGLKLTTLIEREMNRYLRGIKRAAIEMQRRKDIELQIQKEKNGKA